MQTIINSAELDNTVINYAEHMQHALAVAQKVLNTSPNPRVGCVLVAQDGSLLAEGWHIGAGQAHAEAMALQRLAGAANSSDSSSDSSADADARGAFAFVSLEPCSHFGRTPPCSEALIAAGVKTVVIASIDPNPKVAGQGVAMLEAAGIDVIHLPQFDSAAKAINPGYMRQFAGGDKAARPYVRCKLAMSLDGRTAMANGQSQWITGEQARSDVQALRARSDVIITGINTVLADDPSLNVRRNQLQPQQLACLDNESDPARQPLRVILDSQLRTPKEAKMLSTGGRVIIFTSAAANTTETDNTETNAAGEDNTDSAKADPAKSDLSSGKPIYPENVDVIAIEASQDTVNLANVLESLALQHGCQEVLVEAGPTLAGAFVQAGLVDELILFIGAKLLGSDAKPLMQLIGLQDMSDSIELEIQSLELIGSDIKIVATLANKAD